MNQIERSRWTANWCKGAARWAMQVCAPVTDRLVANYRGYWRRYAWALLVLAIAAAADFASTVYFMTRDGVNHELHPAMRIGALWLGPIVGPLLGKLGQLAAIFLVTLYTRRLAPYIFFAATMMYAWAGWYNVWGRELYTPMLFARFPMW